MNSEGFSVDRADQALVAVQVVRWDPGHYLQGVKGPLGLNSVDDQLGCLDDPPKSLLREVRRSRSRPTCS
jgi:hypothetical protein